jgi:hypothetical protein
MSLLETQYGHSGLAAGTALPAPQQSSAGELQLTARQSSPSTAGDIHGEVVNARRVGVVAVAVLAVALMVDAVAGIQSIFGTVKGECERPGLDGEVFS